MNHFLKSTALVISLLATSFVAADPLKSVLDVFVVLTETKDGETVETLIPSEEAEPGSVLEYVLTYTNESEGGLTGFNIKSPVPGNTEYIGESAVASIDAKFTVSIDGGETFETVPVMREVMKDGKKEKVVIPPSEYDMLAWKVADVLAPTKEMKMRYRVIIE